MNMQMLHLAEQLKEAYEGEPWFGKSALTLLNETTPEMALQQPTGQHSILELVWHMANWRAFTINRIRKDDSVAVQQFETDDWRQLDHSNAGLWQQGVDLYKKTHNELVEVLQQQTDDLLAENVAGRNYSYSTLINGILQHDVYHLGQIAYIQKLLRAQV